MCASGVVDARCGTVLVLEDDVSAYKSEAKHAYKHTNNKEKLMGTFSITLPEIH